MFADGRRAAGAVRLHEGRARDRREAVRARPRLGAGAQPHPARAPSTRSTSSASTITSARTRCRTSLLPLRQLLPGAVLEPQLRRERADHDGRELRRAGPRRASTKRPAPSATWCRTTCSRSWPTWRWSRRPSTDSESMRDEKVKVLKAIAPLRAARRGARPVSRLSRRAGRGAGLARRDVRGPAAGDRLLALAGRAVLHPRRQVPAGDLHRGAGAAAPAADRSSRRRTACRTTCASASVPM